MNDEQYAAVVERLERIETMMKTIMRQKLSDRQELLIEKVKATGRIRPQEVEKLFGIQRQSALNLMERVGRKGGPGFHFRKGEVKTHKPSLLWYDKSEVFELEDKKLLELYASTKYSLDYKCVALTFERVAAAFEFTSMDEVRVLLDGFVQRHSEFKIVDGNRLVKA